MTSQIKSTNAIPNRIVIKNTILDISINTLFVFEFAGIPRLALKAVNIAKNNSPTIAIDNPPILCVKTIRNILSKLAFFGQEVRGDI